MSLYKLKGISPLIAATILIAIVLAIGVVLSSSFTSLFKESAGQATTGSSCVGSSLDIMNVNCKQSAYDYSDSDLVGYWSLDSVNGTNYTADLSGQGNDGNFSTGGSSVIPIGGKIENGLQFDGTDDYIQSGVNKFSNSEGTFEAWINPNSWTGRNETIFSVPSEGSTNDTGLVGYWRMNDGSDSTTAADSSGWSNNGTLTNMNTTGNSTSGWTTSGKFGSALQFDGVNDYVNITSLSSMLTIELWKKNSTDAGWFHLVNSSGTLYVNGVVGSGQIIPATNSSGTVIIGKDSAGIYFNGTIDEVRIYNRALSAEEIRSQYLGGLSAHKNSNNNLVFHAGNTTLTVPISSWTGWHHIAGTYSSTGVRLYTDGTLANSTTTFTGDGQFGNYSYIGNDENNGLEWTGTIDEVRIYNRSLSSSEILQHYNHHSIKFSLLNTGSATLNNITVTSRIGTDTWTNVTPITLASGEGRTIETNTSRGEISQLRISASNCPIFIEKKNDTNEIANCN